MALSPVNSMVPTVTVVAEVPPDASVWKGTRKVLNQPNQMHGAAHTATTSATIQLHALQQWQQCGKSREPARLYCAIFRIVLVRKYHCFLASYVATCM